MQNNNEISAFEILLIDLGRSLVVVYLRIIFFTFGQLIVSPKYQNKQTTKNQNASFAHIKFRRLLN